MMIPAASSSAQHPNSCDHLTGKERDAETGLDYFLARYYSGAQGRFTSADPITVTPARMNDPQQLNLYAYTRNNPLKYVDPTGMYFDTSNLSGEDYRKWLKVKALANQKNEKGDWADPNLHYEYERLDSDDRAFVIENSAMPRGSDGEFSITQMSDNDFTQATIKLDFRKIERIDRVTPAKLNPGFNEYEGLLSNRIAKLAEAFGHEAAHAIYALSNMSAAIGWQKLKNEVDDFMQGKGKAPIPPDVFQKIDQLQRYYIPTEQHALQGEQLINGELRNRR
jgi:RHS repeat-associated protein